MTTRTKTSIAISAVVLVVLVVATWWIFLGMDLAKDVDPVTGAVTGPYEAPQVIACAIVLVGLVVGGCLMLPAWVAVLGVALPFTAAWAVQGAVNDDSGLWAVGALIVLVSTLAGGTVVAAVTRRVVRGRKTAAPEISSGRG